MIVKWQYGFDFIGDEMNFKSVNEYLEIIGWSKPEMADRLNVSLRIVGRWANGQNETPLAVLEWLDEIATAITRAGLPQGWHPVALEAVRHG